MAFLARIHALVMGHRQRMLGLSESMGVVKMNSPPRRSDKRRHNACLSGNGDNLPGYNCLAFVLMAARRLSDRAIDLPASNPHHRSHFRACHYALEMNRLGEGSAPFHGPDRFCPIELYQGSGR